MKLSEAKRADRPIVCTFSGGETSAYMAIKLKQEFPDTSFVFANTGEENEETLEFVDKVDKAFDLGVTWIEAVVNPEKGKGTGYKIVSYETAARRGEPFEEAIKKYGLPDPNRLFCTQQLKITPIDKWSAANFDKKPLRAIGIRSDEIDRVRPDSDKASIIYPLAFWWPITKNQINQFWRDQPFRLNLKHYQGNCKVCYKKSFRKLAWIMKENPEHFDFFERMEKEHCKTYVPYKAHNGRVYIYRGHRTVADIREMAKTASEPEDDARVYEVNGDLFGYDDDLDACGSESCEAF